MSSGSLGFDYISLSVFTVTKELGSTEGSGSFYFDVNQGTTYFANVFGVGGGDYDTGLYGLKIEAVPIPPSILLLGSALILEQGLAIEYISGVRASVKINCAVVA